MEMEQELLSRLKVRPCCVLFRPIPILKCGFAQQRRFVHRNGSFILKDRYPGPTRRGEAYGLRQFDSAVDVNNSFDSTGHYLLLASYSIATIR